jgi:hypothetical protein
MARNTSLTSVESNPSVDIPEGEGKATMVHINISRVTTVHVEIVTVFVLRSEYDIRFSGWVDGEAERAAGDRK